MILAFKFPETLPISGCMEKRWFIYSNEIVKGPFSTQEVEQGLDTKKWAPDSLVWWKGQRDWITLQSWQSGLEEILKRVDRKSTHSVWYTEQLGIQKGPMTWTDLIQYLVTVKNPANVRVWTVGQEHWAPLFHYEEIVSELGITRRSFPRAPIVGKVIVHRDNKEVTASISSISEGGLGITDQHIFYKGETVQISIESPLLVSPVRSHAQVVYCNREGVTGFQFINMHAESKVTVIDYVRQFQGEVGEDLKVA
jgi:hypothetical protein